MWRPMGLMGDRERSGRRGKTLAFCSLAMALWGLIPIAAPVPARAVELSAPVAALYSTVSIFPPLGEIHDGLLRLRLQTPRDARFHPRRPQRPHANPRGGPRGCCRRTGGGAERRS